MALADGAEAIAGDLPHAAVVRVDVPLEAGEAVETGIRRASSLKRVQERIADALLTEHEPVVVIGGDCSVTVPALAHVGRDDLALVWFDAHADFNAPADSPSGAFSGMSLRAAIGETSPYLALDAEHSVDARNVILVGARNIDEAEANALAASGIATLPPAEFSPEALIRAVQATSASRVYVHIDVDVLDPSEISGVTDAAPFGLDRAELVDAIKALRGEVQLAGATIAGFAPTTPSAAVDDLGAILRLIGAVA